MATTQEVTFLASEIADFLASCPSREQLLKFRLSSKTEQRALRLLKKSKNGTITKDEQWELDQFEYVESFMRLVKARLQSHRQPLCVE